MDPEEVLTAIFNCTDRHSQNRRDMLDAMRRLLEEHGDLFIASDFKELKLLALEHTDLVEPTDD